MLAVWLAVTASAVTVAWFGIDSVVGAQDVVSPQLLTPVDANGAAGPVLADGAPSGSGAGQTAQPLPTTPAAPSSRPAPTSGPATAPATSAPAVPALPPPTATASPDGQVRRFSMVGGAVVAQFDGDDVTFVSATPTPGYQMKDWIEQGWLRVDFTETSDNDIVYSLFITWNGYSPQWTEAGPDGTQSGS